jgi:hypothetical protein
MSNLDDSIPYGLCHCGCGETTNISTRTTANRWLKKGVPLTYRKGHDKRKYSTIAQYEVDPITGCWNWQHAITPQGYGITRTSNRKSVLAHTLFYERVHGAVPEGRELDHLCRNPRCCNPTHLEAVTHAENSRRGRQAKITKEQVGLIRNLLKTHSPSDVAKCFGVSYACVYMIKRERTWTKDMADDQCIKH